MYILTAAQTVWLPDQASTIASEVDSLFYFILYWVIFFFVLVAVITFYFSWRYKDLKKKGLTSSVDHNTLLEIVWTLIPFILVMIVFFWGARTYIKMNVIPYGAMEVKVKAQKWSWNFIYKEGFSNPQELVVPVNKPIKLLMESQDVLHSFYVPDFRVKMDVIPNRYTQLWFEATKIGEFDILCTEYCGKSHSMMLGKVKVLSQSDYEQWVETVNVIDESIPLVDVGRTTYKKYACNTCHSINGDSGVGPTLKDIWNTEVIHQNGSTALIDENYIRESILDPRKNIVKGFQNGNMPTFKGLIKDREIDGIIEYIKELKTTN